MKTYLKYLAISAYFTGIIFSCLPLGSLAEAAPTYNPPKGKVRRQTRKAGGSRGCQMSLNDAVTLLVPQDHTGTTISAYPTFFWHLSQKLSRPLRFTLLEPGQKPILTKELKPEPGIVALELPQNVTPLEIGKTYRWTVTVICNQNKPSRNLFAQAWIKRAAVPTEVKLPDRTKDTSFCSLTYAKAGIWYDALACNYAELVKDRSNSGSNWEQFQSLLLEIDLEYLAQPRSVLSLY